MAPALAVRSMFDATRLPVVVKGEKQSAAVVHLPSLSCVPTSPPTSYPMNPIDKAVQAGLFLQM